MALSAAVRKKLFGLTVKIHTHLFLFIRLGPFFFVLFFFYARFEINDD